MPSILKRFLEATPYTFPETDKLSVDVQEPAQEFVTEPPASEPGDEPLIDLPPTPTPIDYARLQADAIMESARQEAAELLERARYDMQDELDRLREAAHQEGFHQGFAHGMASAMTEAKEQRKAQSLELSVEVGRFLEKADGARDELLLQTQDELRDLALAIAEKIVRISLKSSGDIVARMIQGATEKMKRKEWVQIYISGSDAKSMAQITPSLIASLSHISDHVRIVPMADDESGTCIIEMPDEIIDASASTQLSNIRELLYEKGSR